MGGPWASNDNDSDNEHLNICQVLTLWRALL